MGMKTLFSSRNTEVLSVSLYISIKSVSTYLYNFICKQNFLLNILTMKKIYTGDTILDHLLLVLTVLSLEIKRTYKTLSLPCWGIQYSREN